MTVFEALWGITVTLFWVGVIAGALFGGFLLWIYFCNWLDERRRERRAEIERALDRKQAELRRTVLALADALAEERVAATQTSDRMVAHAYLTTGRVP